MSVHVIWPGIPRDVPKETIISLAQDSWANHCDWFRCDQCGQNVNIVGACLHAGTWTPVFTGDPPDKPQTTEDAMRWLADAGEMTFSC